ncbi:MAG: hypothetical protein ACKERG_00865 [Candidatus Hodgkinia cicadicola]
MRISVRFTSCLEQFLKVTEAYNRLWLVLTEGGFVCFAYNSEEGGRYLRFLVLRNAHKTLRPLLVTHWEHVRQPISRVALEQQFGKVAVGDLTFVAGMKKLLLIDCQEIWEASENNYCLSSASETFWVCV